MIDGKSLDITEMKIDQLRQIFPEVFSEGKIDFDRLKQVLGENNLVNGEYYELSWAEKSKVWEDIQARSYQTLTLDGKMQQSDNQENQHIFIEGENLEVLKILQRSYFGKVKMIYIDPPYNTGSDSFTYADNYKESRGGYEKRSEILNDAGERRSDTIMSTNAKGEGNFHSRWLSMMYSRLYLSRNLLREDGVIFISIDDNEAANLKLICDEIFGEGNFVGQIVWQKKTGAGAKTNGFITLHEYILCYSKNSEQLGEIGTALSEKMKKMYNGKDEYFEEFGGFATWPLDTTSMDARDNLVFPIIHKGIEIWPRKQWLWSKERVEKAQKENKLVFNFSAKENKYSVRFKGYLYDTNGNEKRGKPVSMFIGPYTQEGTKDFQKIFLREVFSFPKPVALIKQLIKISFGKEAKNNIIVDFFAGSGTTAQAVMELNEEDGGNRQFICVQIDESTDKKSEAHKAGYRVISDITKARIQKVIERIKEQRERKYADNLTEIKQLDKQLKSSLLDEDKVVLKGKIDELERQNSVLTQSLPICQNYKVSESNFPVWRTDIDNAALTQQLLDFIAEDELNGEHDNMFVEMCLKLGLSLSTPYKKENGFYKTQEGIWFLFETYLVTAKDEIVKERPRQVIILDRCFEKNKDQDLSNLQLELDAHKIKLTII